MIYLITGVPGSGKTLYAVSTLLQKLAAEKVVKAGGVEVSRRLVVDGIKDLLIPHEMMAPGVEKPDGTMEPGEGSGIWNWDEWCQPGDVLVVDEVQRWWRPRGMGTKPPKMIQALETHRHKGVDFVIITQGPMLMDQNVRRLVGRHLNVRRIFGGARAIVYDWDGCQADIHRTAGATRTVWSYPKSAYALYKSSELHTKQRQKIPLWFMFPLVVLSLALFVGPKAYSALSGSLTGKGVVSSAAPKSAASAAVVSASAVAPVAAAAPVAPKDEEPEYMGCATMRGVCRCYDDAGATVKVAAEICMTESGGAGSGVVLAQDEKAIERLEAPRPHVAQESDLRLIEYIRTERDRRVEMATWQR